MAIEHRVPASRLTREYFRRWWFWKGVSKSRIEQRHSTTELGVDLARVPRVGGVPRFMFGSAARDLAGWIVATSVRERTRREMMLCYFAGYCRGSRARLGGAANA
jgi:hypothetical protein